MMSKPHSFEALLALWDSPKALSDDLKLPYVSAQMMKHRKSVGSAHWSAFINAAEAKGVHLSLEDFARMKIDREAKGRRSAA